MYTIIYFSPTGNARHLAKRLAAELSCPDERLLALEFTDPGELQPGEHLVVLYPVHGFNAPRTVKRFFKKLPPGRYEQVSLVAVGSAGSWVNAAASSDLRKSLEKKNYPVVVDEQVAMPLTIFMQIPDQASKDMIESSEKKITALARQIALKQTSKIKVPPGSSIINFLGKGEAPAARLFGMELRANDSCTSCGTCWNNCPENNIREKRDGKPGFGTSCIMCMRCIYSCPEQAIRPRFSKFIPIKQGYSLTKLLDQ